MDKNVIKTVNVEDWNKTFLTINKITNISILKDNVSEFEAHIPVQRVNIMLQDDERTLKIFVVPVDEKWNLTLIDGGKADIKTLNPNEQVVLPKVSRVRVVNFWTPFERYGLYENGCVLKIIGTRILIEEK